MAEDGQDAPQETGTEGPTDEQLWEEAPEGDEDAPADEKPAEPVEEEVEEEEPAEEQEPQHDYEARYKELERELHKRNEASARLKEDHNDLRLQLLELQKQKEAAPEEPKPPTAIDEQFFSKEDKETMEEFSELTGTFKKMIQHEMAKAQKPEKERLDELEQSYKQDSYQQFLRNHEAHMKSNVGEFYRDLDKDEGFQSFVLASPALTKMMTESVDPNDHASVMNLYLDNNQDASSKYKPSVQPTKKQARRTAATGLMKNSAPRMTRDPAQMSAEELWDSIPDEFDD